MDPPAATEDDNKILLTLINGTGYVFSVKDYMELRKKHRIVGTFVGTSCTHGFNTHENALPAELSEFETRLLVEEGIALLVSKEDSFLRERSVEEQQQVEIDNEALVQAQESVQKSEKLREIEKNMDRILSGKRKKLEHEGRLNEAKELTAQSVLDEISKNFVFKRENALIEIPMQETESHTAEIMQILPLEADSFECLKYQVFRDIWQNGKNYFITLGESFGADFLVYPGDPLQFHAKYMIIILKEKPTDFKEVLLRPLELITKARLAINVNKICVFAYRNAITKQIVYQFVEWEGDPDKEMQQQNKPACSKAFS